MLHALQAVGKAAEMALGWIFSPHWLPPQDFRFFKWLVVPGYGYGFVLVGIALLELVLPQQRRPWSRKTLLSSTYIVFTGKLGLYSFLVAPLMRQAWVAWGLPSAHLDRTLPLALYMPLAVLVVTFQAYWAHRWMHRFPMFWQIHKIHHSAENLNWSSIYHRHFLELLLQAPTHLITVLLLGTDLVAPFGIIFMTIDVLGHSNVRLDFGRLSYLISTPQAHRIHHSIDVRHYDSNFGNTIMLWDHLFGTFVYDPKDLPTGYGVNEGVPVSFVKQQVLPLAWISRIAVDGLSRAGSRLRGMARAVGVPPSDA
jgi:sterol desaturase/sphingolipid hydroxylase (fatty acid hydroxylase superfamily)